MSYDWTKDDDMDRMDEGYHRVRITKVRRGRDNGTTFSSRAGDPQLMVIFENTHGVESSQIYTLSIKAAWTLKRLMARCEGINLQDLNVRNIEPQHFTDETFAHDMLVGQTLWIHIEHDGPKYVRVTPMPEDEVPIEAVKEAKSAAAADSTPAKSDDDLPF